MVRYIHSGVSETAGGMGQGREEFEVLYIILNALSLC